VKSDMSDVKDRTANHVHISGHERFPILRGENDDNGTSEVVPLPTRQVRTRRSGL
jgi:hypothetical protein